MNILVLTPLYKIIGRESLQRNTEAVHYLVKYWNEIPDVNVYVVNTYLNPGRNLFGLLKKGELKNYRTDYKYVVDGIPVYLTEVQQIIGQKHFNNCQNRKIIKAIDNVIETEGFKPDLIVAHFPTRYQGVMSQICPGVCKVAVLHSTDIRLCNVWKQNISLISEQYKSVFSRSKTIYEQAKVLGIQNLSKKTVNSGVPIVENKLRIWGNGNKKHLLYVGKLIKRKHPEVIISALKELENVFDYDLTIVGKGPEETRLKKMVEKYQLSSKIQFISQIPREKVSELMGDSDIFVMPSEQETLGLVYLEAMMQGCITIGSFHEGIDGIIKHKENGFLVSAGDTRSLIEVLSDIFEMSVDELGRISQNAITTAHYYNEKDMSERYYELLKEQYDSI